VEAAIQWLTGLHPYWLYGVIAAGAAAENVFPPIPADTFVLLGAMLAAAGRANPQTVLLWTLLANVGGAAVIYWLAGRYGHRFFATPLGHWLLHPDQIEQLARFYARWGWPAIFVSRFLPGLRAIVPVFAGVSRVKARNVLFPVALASAIWYGMLVYLGAAAGRNWETIVAFLDRVGLMLLGVTLVLGALIAWWWWRSRP
jgi:membrane protein DedA with SNARE-associated domain